MNKAADELAQSKAKKQKESETPEGKEPKKDPMVVAITF